MTLSRIIPSLTCCILAAFLLLACITDDPDEPSSAGGTAEVAATATGTVATPAATSTPIPGLTPAVGTTPANLLLDPSPRATPAVTQKQLGAFTPSTLPLPDTRDTVLYDVAANTATSLGPGTQGQFSPDGKWMVYSTLAGNNPTEIYLVDLATKQKRALALGRDPRWWGQNRVVFFTGLQTRRVIDITTNQQADFPSGLEFPDFSTVDIDGAKYRLKQLAPDPQALANRFRYVVEDIATTQTVLQFEATQAVPAGVNEVIVATPMQGSTMNLFLVDVRTGASTYVSTARWSTTNFPLAATTDLVAWTEAYCDFTNPGKTRIYDRRTKTITDLDRTFWIRLTPDGKLAPGEFGAKSLIDLSTLRATFVLPGTEFYDRGRDATWTPDYKFASTGFVGGHGGNCG